MPDEVVKPRFGEPEGRVLGALKELRDAIKALGEGVETQPIVSITMENEAFKKVSKYTVETCRHGNYDLNDGFDSSSLSVLWADVSIKNDNPTDYRIVYETVYEEDINGGYLSPVGRTHWHGRRIISCEYIPTRHIYELQLKQPRERYRDTQPDELSRAELRRQEEEEAASRAARRQRDTYELGSIAAGTTVNSRTVTEAYQAARHAFYRNALNSIPTPVAPQQTPPRPAQTLRATFDEAVNFDTAALRRAMDNLIRPVTLPAPELDDYTEYSNGDVEITRLPYASIQPVVSNDPRRNEVLEQRAPTYAAEAQATARITSTRWTGR